MKILHALAQLPCSTGSGIYFSNVIKELQLYGHEQRAVFALQDDAAFHQLPADSQYPVQFKTEALPFPVPGMSDVMPYDSTRYSDMSSEMVELWIHAFRNALAEAAEQFSPDVLILHHLWMLTSLAAEMFPDAKRIGICHHTDLRQVALCPELAKRYVTNLHQLNTILSLSNAHKAEIRDVYPDIHTEIIAVGGGYDSTLFYPAKTRHTGNPVRILYAGKIDPSKGVFALIEAFLALQKCDDSLHLHIVGTPNREYAQRLHTVIGDNESICLIPSVPQNRLADIMREHDVFVLPSFYEGLGLIAVEALACGLWTVSTEVEGLISLLGESTVHSGAIAFVPLTQSADAITPEGTHMRNFIHALESALSIQIGRVREGRVFPDHVCADLSKHSWRAIAGKIDRIMED